MYNSQLPGVKTERGTKNPAIHVFLEGEEIKTITSHIYIKSKRSNEDIYIAMQTIVSMATPLVRIYFNLTYSQVALVK